MLSGPNGSDFIKTDKNQGPDVNISKLHKNFLQQYEPEAIDPESGKCNWTGYNRIKKLGSIRYLELKEKKFNVSFGKLMLTVFQETYNNCFEEGSD